MKRLDNWTSVEDKLPSQGVEAIVWAIYFDSASVEIAYYNKGQWVSCMRGTSMEFAVSHWQAEPDAPIAELQD